jgi:hypothetical protein
VNSRKCSRLQADLLVSSHTIAVTPRGKPAMRITRFGANSDTFVMTSERNYQIFDGDSITMGETKVSISFSFLGKLKALEDQLAAKESARQAEKVAAQTQQQENLRASVDKDLDNDSDDN